MLKLLATALIALAGVCSTQDAAAHGPREARATVRQAEGRFFADPIALLPRAVTSFGAVADQGWLYVLGGYFGRPHGYHREKQSRSFQRLNLADDATWEELPNELALQSTQLVTYDGMLVQVGGMVATNTQDEAQDLHSLSLCRLFDPANRTWEELPALPSPRSSHAALRIGDAVFVVGGWDLGAEDGGWHDTLLRLDFASRELAWSAGPAPFRRRALAAASAGGKLFAIGGIDEEGHTSQRVDVFDPGTGTWSIGPELPDDGFGAAAVGFEDYVYASARSGRVYRLHVDGGEWESLTDLVFPRFFHQLVVDDGRRLLAVGGMGTHGRTRHIESVSLSADAVASGDNVWTIPAPGFAKNRQGMFLRADELYLFSGNGSRHDFSAKPASEGFALDLGTLRTRPIDPYPGRRQIIQAAAPAASAVGFAFGGFGFCAEEALTDAEGFDFDFKEATWSKASVHLPSARSQFGLVEHEGALWVFGGLDFDPTRDRGQGFQQLASVLRWEHGAQGASFETTDVELPRPRHAFGGALLDGKYYIVGGLGEGLELAMAVDVFDFGEQAWSTIPSPAKPRIAPDLVALDGRLFLVGGTARGDEGVFQPVRSIEVFDPAQGAWSVWRSEAPFSTTHVSAMNFHDRLLLVSSQDLKPVLRVALLDVRERPETP